MRDEPSILDGGEAVARRVWNAMLCILNQNNYGQRTGVTTGGTAFSGTPSWAWGYNSKGEVVKADSSEAGFDRAYAYDGIGNRTSGGDQGSPIAYTANALNQYSAIGSINPSYDDDGNATAYPLPANLTANSSLVWDGENRLIQAQVTSGNTVNYVYDSQSRRIAETVGSDTKITIYDGWNPVAEYWRAGLQPAALVKTYTWGIDLSGSMQGAGGVGGLLAVNDGTGTYFPTYDGNGNVSEYLDSTGSTVAHYEYDPFGKTVVATGSKAADFSHRFSTKHLDVNTGLYYYGYRYYDPETGRWPSRDPIEERGGVNLYGFCYNDSFGWYDFLGRDPGKIDPKPSGTSFVPDLKDAYTFPITNTAAKFNITLFETSWKIWDCSGNLIADGNFNIALAQQFLGFQIAKWKGTGSYSGTESREATEKLTPGGRSWEETVEELKNEKFTPGKYTSKEIQEMINELERKACTKGQVSVKISGFEEDIGKIAWTEGLMRGIHSEVFEHGKGRPNRVRMPHLMEGKYMDAAEFKKLGFKAVFTDEGNKEWDDCAKTETK